MSFSAEYQPPADYNTGDVDEVEARWALLKLKRWEPIAVRSEELQAGPEGMSPEIVCRVRRLRRNYQAAVGIAPDERSDLRRWLSGFVSTGNQTTWTSAVEHDSGPFQRNGSGGS